MGASLVYLDRPNTKKDTVSGQVQASQTQPGYRYACSAMQGWRLNMVSFKYLFDKFIRRTHILLILTLLRESGYSRYSMGMEVLSALSSVRSILSKSSESSQSFNPGRILERLLRILS